MDLYTYNSALSEEELADFAAKCETTPLYLQKLACDQRRGKHRIKPRLAALIELHTDKKVMRWESIPNEWPLVWPELVGAPGAPEVVKSDVVSVAACSV